ncbi:MAG TPA: MgtC/SapB family protein [Anaeromyxobacteraceae bacterium]|nr:MgtC/SapB family protein [Anaeromyxobacteraceae bacterium]
MTLPIQDVIRHMVAALLAGAVIGTERSFHGRAAGFRTHALVSLSSSLLMLVTVYQAYWFPLVGDSVRTDPTRMAQGIMTGIGFLGAGVIFKEGLTVRGLTTAASIWATAAIGVLMGVGLYLPGAIATVLALGVLSVFRYIENRFPTQVYANLKVRFAREAPMPEAELRSLLAAEGFKVTSKGYEVTPDGGLFEYRLAIRTVRPERLPKLAETLAGLPLVRAFDVTSGGD